MAKRVVTKKGDIFSVQLDNGNKKYFQYITNDLTQLNSDVIRAFKEEYTEDTVPDFDKIIKGETDFHAHTMINVGVKQNFFNQEGKANIIEDFSEILFRSTNDYGHKQGEEPIKLSHNWHIWHIGDDNFTRVGRLLGENRNAEIGIVIPPYAIVDRIKKGYYDFIYPDFE
ncbi:hypothetical protein [Kaistella sp.]|uniref:hypothetical protein n=1 Tax=Kaistella sp. TaxID=2782235 RepID=UPI003C3F7E8E